MADWSSLPPDLVRRVGDCLLATHDVEYYMDMRAVCRNWRSAAADLLRFHPQNWIMLDNDGGGGGLNLFLNVSDGRLLRRRVPSLRDHFLVGTSDGLLVLADRRHPHAARVVNPVTGSVLRFAAPVPSGDRVWAAAVAGPGSPSLVFSVYYGRYGDAVSCAADPASSGLSSFGSFLLAGMASYAGHAYMVDTAGSIFRISSGTMQDCYCELIALTPPDVAVSSAGRGRYLLVVAGELLLVCRLRGGKAMKIFRVDAERKALEPVDGIGGRAIFLGHRCVAVDAGKFPSVGGDCVYYTTDNGDYVRRYDLSEGRVKRISGFHVRPFSLVQALLNYCVVIPDVKAQMHHFYRTAASC